MEAVLERQEGLNALVSRKIETKVRQASTTVQQAFERMEREGNAAVDFIAPLGNRRKGREDVYDQPEVWFTANGEVKISVNFQSYKLHDNAVGQVATKLNVPSAYLRQLVKGDEWQRKLAQEIMNRHSEWTERNRVLVRTVGEEARGVLSDSYRRLSSPIILTSFMEEVQNQGGVLIGGHFDDTRIAFETICPAPLMLQTPKNGEVALAFGARISSSDYGDGALQIRSFILQGICLNGMVRESVMREIHLGAKLPDNLMLSEKTYELDTLATASAVKDMTRHVFSREMIRCKVEEIMEASNREIDSVQALTGLNKAGKITKAEGEKVTKILMNSNPNDGVQGASTLWKLANGLTAFARTADPRRERELAEIAGDIIAQKKYEYVAI